MSLRNINLKVLLSFLLIVLGTTHAYGSVCNPLAMGVYWEASPLSGNPLLKKWVEILPKREDGIVEIEANIPWGTKSAFYKLHVDCHQTHHHAKVVYIGFGQYDIGKNPIVDVLKNPGTPDLFRIYTGIRVPGFSGVYEFQKE